MYQQSPWEETAVAQVQGRASGRFSSKCYRSYRDPCNRSVLVPNFAFACVLPTRFVQHFEAHPASFEPGHQQDRPTKEKNRRFLIYTTDLTGPSMIDRKCASKILISTTGTISSARRGIILTRYLTRLPHVIVTMYTVRVS